MSSQSVRGRGMGAYTEDGAARRPFEANLIDFRHSVVQAHKRADAGDETLEICAVCMCEVDITPAPHRPGCAGIGKSRATSSPVLGGLSRALPHSPAPKPPVVVGSARNGLDALARMDDGLPQEPELELDDQEDDVEVLEEREPEVPVEPTSAPPAIEPPVAPSRSSSIRRGRVPVWTRESAIAAVQAFAEANGHPPSHKNVLGNRSLPSAPTMARLFGSLSDLVEAAGFDRPHKGTSYARPVDDVAAREAASQERAQASGPQPASARSSDTVDVSHALAEPGPERLGPDDPGSAGARDFTPVRAAVHQLVDAIFEAIA